MPYKQREELSESELDAALQTCEREPIHIPGSIQPYGLLFAVRPEGRVIVQVSANVEVILGTVPPDLLGTSLDDLIGKAQVDYLLQVARDGELQPMRSTVVRLGERDFDAICHYSGPLLVVELEFRHQALLPDHAFHDEMRTFTIGIRAPRTLNELFDYVTASVRDITGFDRVMLYRFDDVWNGQVVSESRADHMPSYLGLHFPASDIPAQARALYMKSFIRQISDISYAPVALVPDLNPETGAPLDMSLCMLRSVSPIHVQYLANMGVKASMSISVFQNGRFWGLIACHHNSPHHVPYTVRLVSEIMGHVFSAHLSSMSELADITAREQRKSILERISTALLGNHELSELIGRQHLDIMDALKADGLTIWRRDRCDSFGRMPPKAAIEQLVNWLDSHNPASVFKTRAVDRFFADKNDLREWKGGLLAAPINMGRGEYIIWRRDSQVEKVTWAGKPEKTLTETRAGHRLMPRSSFKVWKEEVQNDAVDWSLDDIEMVHAIIGILAQNARLNADRANAAKTEFLAHMSHELRTPLNAIIGIAAILDRQGNFNDKQKQLVSTLGISSDALLNIINNSLDLSKIEAGELTLETRATDIRRELGDVATMLTPRALEKHIALRTTIASDVPEYFLSDGVRLRQILVNLVGNAIKYTDTGQVNIAVDCLSDKGGAWLTLTIADTGIGMSEDQIARIFNPYAQADDTITRRFGGTGLGLTITKKLVELMSGDIKVESRLGQGSTFEVRLPLISHIATAHPPKVSIPTPRPVKSSSIVMPNRRNILLVEDYEANVLVARTLLENLGYEIDIAKDGEAAVSAFARGNYDLILMDINLPRLDGYEATQAIRRLEADSLKVKTSGQGARIIGMTAHALGDAAQKCYDMGMDGYIAKPFSLDDFEQIVAKFIP
jgi:light-regulated signal transduction histidine kinase (bacteriophytochrome)/CheY-like chemotaxis protein